MSSIVKSRGLLLQEFAEILLVRNPMNLGQEDPLEYENEALSILSRFNEAALQIPDVNVEAVAQIAKNIVNQVFEFWFEDAKNVDLSPIAYHLLSVYIQSYETSYVEQKQVKLVTIGE